MIIEESVSKCKGVGEKTTKLLDKVGIRTIADLLTYYPRDYVTFPAPVTVSETENGKKAAVFLSVRTVSYPKKIGNKTLFIVCAADGTGELQIAFFNQPYLQKQIKSGGYYIFYGLIQEKNHHKEMSGAKLFSREEYRNQMEHLQPVYPLTNGLKNSLLQKTIHQAIEQTVLDDYFPASFLCDNNLLSRREAITDIHFPQNEAKLLAARKRLSFEEFFFFLLLMRKNRELGISASNQFDLSKKKRVNQFIKELPFPLTSGQKKAFSQIQDDFVSPHVMNRLVQGDVGCGKTLVAFLALLQTIENGYQGAMMAPTEVLAKQHFQTINEYITKYRLDDILHPIVLVGSMTAAQKKVAYTQIADGSANLIIGTHAIIQEKVVYQNLACVITDEQHRFGVRQRQNLAEKGNQPHVLVMSATPIPRTLAIVLYGDLSVSNIRELPANRLPIKNCVIPVKDRKNAYAFLLKQVAEKHQCYIICPQVEAGELEDLENVEEYAEKLKEALPPQIRIAYLHGKLKPDEKQSIMEQFANAKIDILVSTTVIEVGINVPNATVMMVENAERFGLAQLHQLRGRVGRGSAQSYCIFIRSKDDDKTTERLDILNHSNDGFHISSEDLRLRGPGELFGIRQSGELAFRVADIYADANELQAASEAVDLLLKEDPHLRKEENAGILSQYEYEKTHHMRFDSI